MKHNDFLCSHALIGVARFSMLAVTSSATNVCVQTRFSCMHWFRKSAGHRFEAILIRESVILALSVLLLGLPYLHHTQNVTFGLSQAPALANNVYRGKS